MEWNIYPTMDVLAGWKNICSTVFVREGMFVVHLGRKAGHLFGVWGEGQDTDQVLSARQNTIKMHWDTSMMQDFCYLWPVKSW
jgi:hypothetical protein